MAQKRVGLPQVGSRGPTSKRSRLDAEELLMEVDKLMEEAGVEVKKEPRDEYSDLIRSKIFDDDEEEEEEQEEVGQGGNGGDEEDVPTQPNSPVKSSDEKLGTDERKDFYELVEKTKISVQKALASKNKQIDELKGETLKMRLEIESISEKYVKYKNMAKQNTARNHSNAKVKELEEANKDIRTKADLRENLLKEEREKCEKLIEENKRFSARYVELEKKVKMLMSRLQESSKTEKLDAIQDFKISNAKVELKSTDLEQRQPPREMNEKNTEKSAVKKLDVKEAARIPPKPDAKLENSDEAKDDKNPLLKVVESVMAYKDSDGIELAQPFWKLPSKKKMPEYYKVIQSPMDIARIQDKVEQAEYTTLAAFEKDFTLVWENARKYNNEDSAIFQDSETLHSVFTGEMEKVKRGEADAKKNADAKNSVDKKPNLKKPKETSWLLDEKRQQSGKESVKPIVEAKKVSNKFPGLSVAPTATRVPKVAETPSKSAPKTLPFGISVNAKREEKAKPEKEIKVPMSPVRRAKGLRNISISKNVPPPTPTSKAPPTPSTKSSLSFGKKKDSSLPEPSSQTSSGISIRKSSEDKLGLDNRVKSMIDTVKKAADSANNDDTTLDESTEEDSNASKDENEGSGIRKYDDLLSRIKGQLKVVGNM